MSTATDARYPLVRFSTLPADTDLGWHRCGDYDGDFRESEVSVQYRRFGWHHGLTCCQTCLGDELRELHNANPLPTEVEVAVRAEQDEECAA